MSEGHPFDFAQGRLSDSRPRCSIGDSPIVILGNVIPPPFLEARRRHRGRA